MKDLDNALLITKINIPNMQLKRPHVLYYLHTLKYLSNILIV